MFTDEQYRTYGYFHGLRFENEDQRFQMFEAVLWKYRQLNPEGGSLHVVVQDGNDKLTDVEWCLGYAKKNKDKVGEYLCQELLYFGPRFIKNLVRNGAERAWAREQRLKSLELKNDTSA